MLEAICFISLPIRVYNACSSECFGNTSSAADGNTPFHPRSPYAVSNSAAFWEVANYREAYGLLACSGIPFNHESTRGPERFVTKKIVSAACRIAAGSREKLSLGNISIYRDLGWAPEFVEAMWLMLQQGEPDDYVIDTEEGNSLEGFVAAALTRWDSIGGLMSCQIPLSTGRPILPPAGETRKKHRNGSAGRHRTRCTM